MKRNAYTIIIILITIQSSTGQIMDYYINSSVQMTDLRNNSNSKNKSGYYQTGFGFQAGPGIKIALYKKFSDHFMVNYSLRNAKLHGVNDFGLPFISKFQFHHILFSNEMEYAIRPRFSIYIGLYFARLLVENSSLISGPYPDGTFLKSKIAIAGNREEIGTKFQFLYIYKNSRFGVGWQNSLSSINNSKISPIYAINYLLTFRLSLKKLLQKQ